MPIMLDRQEIRQLGLVIGAVDASFRDCTYDLRIATIEAKDAPGASDYVLGAQGIAAAISKEELQLPMDVCAIASVKTSLSRIGVLALNTGIIDPGWHGPISSFLVNFGNEPHTLIAGDVFLRITFYRLARASRTELPPGQMRTAYERDVRDMFRNRLSNQFLDIDKVAREGGERLMKQFWDQALKNVGLIAVGLTILTFLLNAGSLWLAGRWTLPIEPARADVVRQYVDGELRKLAEENQKLRQELEALKTQQRNKK